MIKKTLCSFFYQVFRFIETTWTSSSLSASSERKQTLEGTKGFSIWHWGPKQGFREVRGHNARKYKGRLRPTRTSFSFTSVVKYSTEYWCWNCRNQTRITRIKSWDVDHYTTMAKAECLWRLYTDQFSWLQQLNQSVNSKSLSICQNVN